MAWWFAIGHIFGCRKATCGIVNAAKVVSILMIITAA